MKLKPKSERRAQYLGLVEACRVSMGRRRDEYDTRRRLYLWGSDQDTAPANKVEAHIDTQAAILYSGDTARFTVDLPTGVDPKVVQRTPAVKKKLNDLFRDSHLDVLFGQGTLWSLVFNSTFIKFVPKKNGFTPYIVEPMTFGVLREDVATLDAQEAFIHEYFISRTELESRLEGHPRQKEILDAIPSESKKQPTTDAGPIRAIATSVAFAGNVTGYLNTTSVPDTYDPEVSVDLVRMTDLWVQDDAAADYRTVIFAGDAYETVYDGQNLFLPQDHPFVQIRPNPMYWYFWGESDVARLRQLQEWRNERVSQIRQLLNLNVDPPTVYSGFPMVDEKKFAARIPGGILTSQMPNAKADVLRPTIPQDIFYEVAQIDGMFDDASGIPNLMQGNPNTTKDASHAEKLASFSTLRARKKALVIEDCLDAVATKMMKVARAYITDRVVTDTGDDFMLSEYPEDVTIRTDGHSQSPLFSAQTRETAQSLLDAKAINRGKYIQMMNPPGVEELLLDLKDIEKQEADKAAQDERLAEMKITHARR